MDRTAREALLEAAIKSDKPLLTECPFAERIVRSELEDAGFKVHSYFVIEPVSTVSKRYLQREKKLPKQNVLTRAATIINRAKEWDAPHGTSDEILKLLQGLL